MCKSVANKLNDDYGNKLSISDYVSSHDVSVLYDNDIVVSTAGSSGTGKDIPYLRTAISTVALGSIQRNLQMLGRLRPIKDDLKTDPTYLWMTCLNIPQHMKYDKEKIKVQFPAHTKSINTIYSDIVV
jgi:hypothetical protein